MPGYRFIPSFLILLLLVSAGKGLAAPQIVQPADGSTLSGSAHTFIWSPGNTDDIDFAEVSKWWLYVGTSVGASDIANSGDLGSATAYDVIGIPAGGSIVHARLWYLSAERWSYVDSSYTPPTLDGEATMPTMTSPLNGSELLGSRVEFKWRDNGTPVNFWWLHIGSRQGSNDIYDSGQDVRSQTSVTVDQLPVDGSTVYVRLWFHTVAERWQFVDTQYLASGGRGDATIYTNDFSSEADGNRIDQFVSYRDPFVVAHVNGSSDHVATGGINCTGPEETRMQTRNNPSAHVYQCLPGGDPALGHQMAYAMDTSGYGFVGALPDQVFEGVEEVSVDINTTSAGSRNFVEIKVIPADQVYVNAMPCIPDLPCNDGWDYDDIGAVGAATNSQDGTGLTIATPSQPDGYHYDHYNGELLGNGDYQHALCSDTSYCFHVATHESHTGIRERYAHIFRDNGNGTLAFGIENADSTFSWVEAPGSFPQGPVRVVVAFHNYTGTKSGNGPGFSNNVSPSTGGFTWHWDNLSVKADISTPSIDYFGSVNADRIVTPIGCVAFSQGQRSITHNRDITPMLHCVGDADL